MSSSRPIRLWALVALALTVVLGACAESTPDDDAGPATTTASSPAAAVQLDDADVTFLQGMVPHHAQAVEMAEMVQGRTAHPEELGALAETIIATQQEEIDLMNGLLQRAGEDPADPEMGGMDHGDMQGDMDMGGMMSDEDMTALAALDGDAFDQMFLQMMIAHHQGAIDAAEQVLAEGEHPEVATLADDVIDAQRAEITQMEEWQANWSA